jgi:hypothetical protein
MGASARLARTFAVRSRFAPPVARGARRATRAAARPVTGEAGARERVGAPGRAGRAVPEARTEEGPRRVAPAGARVAARAEGRSRLPALVEARASALAWARARVVVSERLGRLLVPARLAALRRAARAVAAAKAVRPEGRSFLIDNCYGACLPPTQCREVMDCSDCGDAHCVESHAWLTSTTCVPPVSGCGPGNLCSCLEPCPIGGCQEEPEQLTCVCRGC